VFVYTRQIVFPPAHAHAHETFTTVDLRDPRQLYAADRARRAWLTAETFTA